MIYKIKNTLILLIFALFLIGCDAISIQDKPLSTLAPTISINFPTAVPTELVGLLPPAIGTDTPAPGQNAGPTATGDAATLTTATADSTPGADYPGPDGLQRQSQVANQVAAGTPTQTPAGIIVVGGPLPTQGAATATPGGTAPTQDPNPSLPPPVGTIPPDPGDPNATPFPTITPSDGSSSEFITFFLIAVGDNGASGQPGGCGDSLVEVSLPLESVTDQPLSTSVGALLRVKDQYYGDMELYNPLWQSDLTLESAGVIEGGIAQIALTGQLNPAEQCDPQRIREMLEATAKAVPGVQTVNITLNGQPLFQAQ